MMNYYPNPYQNIYNPYQNQMQQMQNAKQEIVRVNGKNGAEAFQMPPNSAILLLDETAPIVWLKQTDGAGYPTITPYNISPMQTQQQQETSRYEELEKRITELEGIVNAKSNFRNVKQKSNDGESGQN